MFQLKLVLAFLGVIAHCVLSENKEAEIWEECEKEHKFKDARLIKFSDPSIPKEAKCALACVFEKFELLKDDGTIDKEKEKEAIADMKNEELKKKLLKAIDECDGSAKENKCDTAFEFVKCKHTKAGIAD